MEHTERSPRLHLAALDALLHSLKLPCSHYGLTGGLGTCVGAIQRLRLISLRLGDALLHSLGIPQIPQLPL